MVDIGKRLPVKAIFFNDVEVGYYGALGFEPGINVVSGTGSIAIGFDESGKVARSGGFGPELEGDEGSGHYVGRRLLNQFTRQVDLRQERTMLYEALVEHFNLKKDIYLFGTLMDTGGLERDKMASLSRLAAELAQKGDPVCLQIFEDTTCELELLTLALERQLNFEKRPIKVSYSGGMFAAKELILEPLSKKLEKHDMILVEPKYEPVYGACLRAMKIYP
jgi:N-acetylglucosamine kinase-like BadF-type ATPase